MLLSDSLIVWQAVQKLRDALFPGLIRYLSYVLLTQRRGIGSCDLYTLRGFGVAVVSFEGEYATNTVSFGGPIDKARLAFFEPFFDR